MKIDTTNKDPYKVIIDTIRELTKDNPQFEYIVNIKTSILGNTKELLIFDGFNYCWLNDWYEGGEVELLGFIDIDSVRVPLLEEK